MSYDTLPNPDPLPASDFIKPIETRYAGCRFRSRLEARWAVFFDALGIEWQYEPEGYIVAGKPYLPDFWLPGLKLWVEVKGVIDQPTLDHLLEATDPANGLPATPAGERWFESQATGRILVLGQIPRLGDCGWVHTRLDFDHGDPCWRAATFTPWFEPGMTVCAVGEGEPFVGPGSAPIFRADALGSQFVNGTHAGFLQVDGHVDTAYRAARMARFEHGESGAPQPMPAPKKRRRVPASVLREVSVHADADPTVLHTVPVEVAKPARARRPAASRKAAKVAVSATEVASDGHWTEMNALPKELKEIR